MSEVKIAVDCFGGDHSPEANVNGGLLALGEHPDLKLVFCGDEEKISAVLAEKDYPKDRIEILPASEVITCDEKPTDAIRQKKDSSMMRGISLLRKDESIAGLVSTGSTGALVAASTLLVGRLKGVYRPTFCPILPSMKGGIVGICDSGANVDCSPDQLLQFAVMGSLYLEKVYGIESPRVGLLNVGVEEGKGDDLRKETYARLKEMKGINFVGNVEARDNLSGNVDLIVCDGFSGNILVKATEGTALELLKKLKKDIKSKFIYKLGALLMMKMFKEEKRFMNYQNYGGSVLLGCEKVIVKGHGSSDATAVAKCIDQAYRMETGRLGGAVENLLAENGIAR